MTIIEVNNISKEFLQSNKKNKINKVLNNISFKIEDGEFVTIFGPNGCGKTTLLNIIAGIENPTFGEILINKQNPEFSKKGFVFQNYNESMLPWRTALGNIELALEIQNINNKKRKEIAQHFLNKVDLLKYKDNYFYELSGGMKQLVAICRAFAYNPEILLMDEPFSSLDYSTTRKMELELLKVWRETKKTTLFVSHDIDEAILLADKIIILSKRPAIIKEIIKIDLPRPRKLEMLSSKKFFEIRKKILRLFENEKQ